MTSGRFCTATSLAFASRSDNSGTGLNRDARPGVASRDILRILISTCLLMISASCATSYQRPDPYYDTALRERAKSVDEEGIQVSAVIPTLEESKAIFGVDMTQRNIQPLWLEIRNDTDRQMFFVPTGLDPEAFPLEVAYGFHKPYNDESRERFNRYIESTAIRFRIDPRSTVSGFVFTNPDEESKLVTVDLFGLKWTKSISLVAPTPDREFLEGYYARLVNVRDSLGYVDVEDDSRLREALEALPCCTTGPNGRKGEPLNLVLIGALPETARPLSVATIASTLPRHGTSSAGPRISP